MSLRRSARSQAKSDVPQHVQNGSVVKEAVAKKRARKSTVAEDVAVTDIAQDGDLGAMPPPPSTPNKRRKRVTDSDVKPPPITPTPSAIGLMISNTGIKKRNYSSGDIDDASPPPPKRQQSKPSHADPTLATLVTPGGTQVEPTYSNFEESPSKAATALQPLKETDALLNAACAHLISVDESLKPLIERHNCRIFSSEGLKEEIDPFRSLSSGIMAQQVSGAAAKSIKNKFIALFPDESCPNGFPTPAVVAKTPLTTLRTAGLSQRKAEYIQGLAEKFTNGELTIDMLMNGTDEEVMEHLVAVRGLGKWSVEMFMCFGLKRMDIFSTGDLGVQRGMAAYAGKDVKKLKAKGGGKWKYMSEQDMLDNSEKFKPYRSLFMWYMWRIEDVDVDAVQDN